MFKLDIFSKIEKKEIDGVGNLKEDIIRLFGVDGIFDIQEYRLKKYSDIPTLIPEKDNCRRFLVLSDDDVCTFGFMNSTQTCILNKNTIYSLFLIKPLPISISVENTKKVRKGTRKLNFIRPIGRTIYIIDVIETKNLVLDF